jgi:hypothetical protein
VFDNEQNCIQALLDIHNNGNPIDLDPMYFKGGFYKGEVSNAKITQTAKRQ